MNKRTCSIGNCVNDSHARGLCQTHYSRWRKGSPMDTPIRQLNSDPEGSFKTRTTRQGSCLIWTGAETDTGYGIIWAGGKLTRAHRYAWERVNGPIPAGMSIDHMCFNKKCCEVGHLRLATHKQNTEHTPGAREGNPSGIRGVHKNTKGGKPWRVRVKHNYIEYHGGTYDTIAEAETAAIALRKELFTHNLIDRQAS